MGNLWNFRRVLLYSLSGVFGLDYLYAFDTGRESCTHLVCNTIKIASARYLARQEKLPALFSLCYFGDFFYLCVEYSNATTATILQFISPVFILFYNRLVYQKRASKSAVFYVLVAMLGVCLMATKGDLSQLSMTPLALITGLLSAMGVMFNVILPQPFAKRYGFVPTVGWGMILAGLFSNVLSPVYQLSFTLDIWSILICLIIAFFGTAFAFFISMKAVSLVSPLVVAVISASEPLSSALLSVLFLGLVVDWSLLLAIALIILPMIFLSIEEAKESR